MIDKIMYCGGECIFKVVFDKDRSKRMATKAHYEVVYVVAKMTMFPKSIVMTVDGVKCILMYLNLIKMWLFEHCTTCGE